MRIPISLLLTALSLLAQDPPRNEGPATGVLVWTGSPSRARILRDRHPESTAFQSLPLAAARLTRRQRAALEAELGPGQVFEDREYRTSLIPAVPVSGAPYVWDAGFTGGSQAAAVIDTGINAPHPAFLGVNIVSKVFLNSGRQHECFGDDASTGNDLQGHGTRTASILAGQAVPPLFPGYFGAARGIGTLYSLKAGFRARAGSPCPVSDGILLSSDILAAMDYLVTNTNVKIVNLSLGVASDSDDDVLARVFDYLGEQYGLTLVFAAGNRGTEASINTPGTAYNGLTVANMDDKGTMDTGDDSIHPTSTRGPTIGLRNKPDLAASGTRVYAADFSNNGFNAATGTSAAAPIVAGAAALLLDAGLPNDMAVKALLLNSTGGDGVWKRDAGWGELNAATAFDQRRNLLVGAVPPKSSRFFKGAVSGPARATMVWHRHVDASSPLARSPLNELAVSLYRKDGTLLSRAGGPRDNVAAFRIEAATGDYVVRVEAPGGPWGLGVFEEDFALAISQPGLAPARGPKLDLHCDIPSAVAPGAAFTVNCLASNTGDLDLFQVAGSLLAPQGFSGGGPQSFGNLAAGQSRTVPWNLTASSVPGSFFAATAGSAASYGVAVEATATAPEIQVSTQPTLALDPRTAMLSVESPSRTVKVSAVGGSAASALPEPVRVSAASAPWFEVSLASGVVTVSRTDAASALAPGEYQGQYTVTAGSLTARGTVMLRVPAASPAIESSRIATAVRMAPGCPAPDAALAVSEAVAPVYWFIARNAALSDQMVLRWSAPGGQVVETVSLTPVAGEYCYSASMDVKRVEAARRFGEWKAELTWNGIRQPAVAFTVNPELRLTSGVCAASAGPRRIAVCPEFVNAPSRGRILRLDFRRPDGDLDGVRRIAWEDAGQPVEYSPSLASAGVWRVDIFADGAVAGTVEVPVEGPVEVRRAELVDGRLDFALGEVAGGTRGRVEFVAPSGEVREARDLDLAGVDGVVESSVDPPQLADLGRWRIRLFWDGVLIRTIPYDRLPARIVDQALTADTQKGRCAGVAVSEFGTLDPSARLWTVLEGVAEGTRAVVEFREAGAVRVRGEVPAFNAEGSWCVSATLPILGSQGARSPGKWDARLLVEGIEMSVSPFEIRRGAGLASQTLRSAPVDPAREVVPVGVAESTPNP